MILTLKDDEEGDEDDDDEGSEMELDEDFPDINAAPHIRFERFDRDDDLIIEFDNMFSNNGKCNYIENYKYLFSQKLGNTNTKNSH